MSNEDSTWQQELTVPNLERYWFDLQGEARNAAPQNLSLMLQSIITMQNEMALRVHERADAPQSVTTEGSTALALSPDEQVLKNLLVKYHSHPAIGVKEVLAAKPSLKGNQGGLREFSTELRS